MSRRILIDDDAAQYANLEARLKRLESTVARLVGADVYKEPLAYGTDWDDYGGTLEGGSYSRIGRVVVLQGVVSKSGGTPTNGDVIATLPAGFRPAVRLILAADTAGASATHGRVDIYATGEIKWVSGATAEQDYTSLSGIAFVVD
jgi:hypothetical protein